ncbi:SOS response-associated peptidase family protein [Rhodohalobacter sp.]|uniref:SOS response-associated peptidase family protein n=1 Tax=Rhodohalobacter sp. TaxID=1974210 RepID=UPI002ACEC2BA|nr:SOS response-associated peptidase family protein [Rhodohalobacter sp.]MDZ7754822.1 SOS response-associated peptidase family protein [Rhodohalobacter sp.]
MAKRVAFFAGKESVENYFNLESNRDNIFEPHYNLSAGHHILIVHKMGAKPSINRVRWSDEQTHETTVDTEKAIELLQKKEFVSCAVPLSGFYIWKDDKEKGSPFFVRMINDPLMVAAGIYNKKADYFKLITMPSNVLINPMSETMPVLLDRELSFKWLEAEEKNETADIIEKAKKLFLLTDLSVVRVSEKVNDPSNNDEKLIQPIPK